MSYPKSFYRSLAKDLVNDVASFAYSGGVEKPPERFVAFGGIAAMANQMKAICEDIWKCNEGEWAEDHELVIIGIAGRNGKVEIGYFGLSDYWSGISREDYPYRGAISVPEPVDFERD